MNELALVCTIEVVMSVFTVNNLNDIRFINKIKTNYKNAKQNKILK